MERAQLCFLLSLLIACGRGTKENTSSVTIRAPTHLATSDTLVALPNNRVACYGINVKGVGTSVTGNACSPPTGLLAGFVSSGQSITASVPRGLTVTIELYLYLQPTGQNNPCPGFVPAIANDQLGDMYLVGTASNIPLTDSETVVTINATFPGITQNIAQQLGMSAACKSLAGGSEPNVFQISGGAQVMTGTGVVLKTRAGKPAQAQLLTGGTIQMIVR